MSIWTDLLPQDVLSIGSQPVYVPDGNGGYTQIGYFTSANDPCHGNIFTFQQYLAPQEMGRWPPSTWLTKDFWGTMIPLGKYCLDKNVTPSWASVADNGSATVQTASGPITYTQTPGGSLVAPNTTPDLGTLLDPIVIEAQKLASGAGSLVTGAAGLSSGLLLFGGGALALILLMRRR